MDVLLCGHCGYKNDAVAFPSGNCPKCGSDITRNLSTVDYCFDCIHSAVTRSKTDNTFTGYTCPVWGKSIDPYTYACDSSFKSKRKVIEELDRLMPE